MAHLPRNMCKKKTTRISHALVLCASFRETMYCQSVTKYLSRKLTQRTNTWINRVCFFYTYSWVNGLCFCYFHFFSCALSVRSKITLTLSHPPYVSRLSDHTIQ